MIEDALDGTVLVSGGWEKLLGEFDEGAVKGDGSGSIVLGVFRSGSTLNWLLPKLSGSGLLSDIYLDDKTRLVQKLADTINQEVVCATVQSPYNRV